MRRRRPNRVELYESPEFLALKARLAANVARLRAAKGWTQEEAAAQCGMSTRLLQRVEAGDANVTLVTLARLGSGLGAEVGELLS